MGLERGVLSDFSHRWPRIFCGCDGHFGRCNLFFVDSFENRLGNFWNKLDRFGLCTDDFVVKNWNFVEILWTLFSAFGHFFAFLATFILKVSTKKPSVFNGLRVFWPFGHFFFYIP